MRGLHLLFCPAPGGHQPPSGGSPPSPAPSRRPRCRRASCLPGSSPWARCLGRSSTHRVVHTDPTRLPPSVRLQQQAVRSGGRRWTETSPPRVEARRWRRHFLAAGCLDTWHYCQQRFHQRLQLASAANPATLHYIKGPNTPLVTNHTYPADRIKGSTQVI